jgi:hypothetical protein
MTLRQYLTTMIIGSFLCWTSWAFVIVNIDPDQSNITGFIFFYLSLFLALVGTISILAFLTNRYFSKELLPIFRYVQRSFRFSIVISGVLVLLLFLQGIRVLNIWNLGIFLLSLLFVVSFLISTKHNSPRKNDFLNQ